MKKKFCALVFTTCTCMVTCAAPGFSFAQSVQEEAVNSLSTAQEFVKNGNYPKALEEINYAMAKLNELTAEGLLTFIPEPPDGYTLLDKSSQGVGQGAAIVGNAGATGSYQGPDDAGLELNISIGGVVGQMGSLAAFGTMFSGMASEAGMKTIRIHGYTGTVMFDQQNRSGNLIIQVGDKTSVQIEGTSIDSTDGLQALAQKMDLVGLDEKY
jgi:hypothetical protein